MIKTLLVAALAGGTGFAGWVGGSIWPAPPEWTDSINRGANDLRARLRMQDISFDGLRQLMPQKQFEELTIEMSSFAVAAGEVIMVDRESSTLEEELDNLALDADAAIPAGFEVVDVPAATPAAAPAPPPTVVTDAGASAEDHQREEELRRAAEEARAMADAAPAPAAPTVTQVVVMSPVSDDATQVFAKRLALCPRMKVSNPPASSAGAVTAYRPLVDVKGVRIATFPTKEACMSSGFGPRSDRLHKGLDYHAEVGVPVLAGGDGEIIEMKYRNDYGNMILIAHGGGVYTRYAHLASFGKGLMPGVTLRAGEQIGLMGNTAAYQIPMHLHYELLLGDYGNPKGSFGLEAADPLSFPPAG